MLEMLAMAATVVDIPVLLDLVMDILAMLDMVVTAVATLELDWVMDILPMLVTPAMLDTEVTVAAAVSLVSHLTVILYKKLAKMLNFNHFFHNFAAGYGGYGHHG